MAVDSNAAVEAGIKDYVMRKLGHPAVAVELTDEQVCDAYEDACDWFSRFIAIGSMKESTITLSSAITEYGLDDDSGDADKNLQKDVKKVTDVVFEFPQDPFSIAFAFADVEIQYPQSIEGGSYSSILQELQYREQARDILSADFDWTWNEVTCVLFVSPIPVTGLLIRYQYVSDGFDFSKLSRYHIGILKERAFAEAMYTLGIIRSKYSELPTSTGTVTLNGESLISFADTKMDALEEKIRSIQAPLGFFAD